MASQSIPAKNGGRPDVVATTNEALVKALMVVSRKVASARTSGKRLRPTDDESRVAVRKDLVESPDNDPTGFERIIGESDLTSINYLDRGRRAAAAVCRIRAAADGGEWYGTAFLVAPRLLMTNHHVLATPDDASQAEAEFCFEHDVDGVLQRPVQFNLRPHEVFFTSPELDVSFVAVSPLSDGGTPIERFGWLPLLPPSGKAIDKEWVTIIQHPNGGPKQISIRSNMIVTLPKGTVPAGASEHFVYYLTDTEPGSSGSPVLNDQWQVVALHHKAVPMPRKKNATGPTEWLANEGVRISSIYNSLETQRFTNPQAASVLERLEAGLGFQKVENGGAALVEDFYEKDAKPYPTTRWKKGAAIGYDDGFLSERIPLSQIYAGAKSQGLLAPLLRGSGHELAYHRYSVVVHARRKFALLTAVNINGGQLKHPGARQTVWRIDARMDAKYQPAGNFYEKDRGSDKIQFSRGHLVRRFDPSWGTSIDIAKQGDQDTFHYSNAAPQFQKYNDVDWGNLEDYLLDKAQTSEKKMTVFQGPIFRDDDPWYGKDREDGPWRIPLSYWKIAVLEKKPGTIAVAAFILGQTQYVKALYEAKVFSGLRPYRPDDLRSRKIQTTVHTIEDETGLDFSAIRRFDAHGGLESTRRTRWLNRLDDVMI
jgi:endonuclease G, mitochondrial